MLAKVTNIMSAKGEDIWYTVLDTALQIRVRSLAGEAWVLDTDRA